MLNYLYADLCRVGRKKTFRGAVLVFIALFAALIFIYDNPTFTAEQYLSKMASFLSVFPLIVGVFVFLAVYADDFKCHAMQVAIGYGLSRSAIIWAKLVESLFLLAASSVLIAALLVSAPLVLGLAPSAEQIAHLLLLALAECLRALGYIALAAVLVFWTQETASGLVLFVLLASKTVFIVLSMVLGQEMIVRMVGDLSRQLYTAQLYTAAGGGDPALWLIAPLCYIVLPTLVSLLVFRKKELNF